MLVMRSEGKITLFKDDSLLKCQNILNAQRKQNLKYNDLTLPELVDGRHGFHIQCYRIFSALSKLQRRRMLDDKNSEQISLDKNEKPQISAGKAYLTRSNVDAPKPSSSTGIFPEVCLFCCAR